MSCRTHRGSARAEPGPRPGENARSRAAQRMPSLARASTGAGRAGRGGFAAAAIAFAFALFHGFLLAGYLLALRGFLCRGFLLLDFSFRRLFCCPRFLFG